ncbi:monocyte chemotactic protein 1B-like [Thalassophryne amazonica]|uniref:monocyte chemotactic protein 1B-like n=1 Tax=Thalassophryne amazonica TaxID=390379 RepID=UPI001471598A|nr:monocyte chemotactic protein 1B-like [Thalassophryne amazonica]
MAAARLTLSVFVVLMLAAAINVTQGMRSVGPKKCCFQFRENPLPKNRVSSYMKTSQSCSNPAVVLETVAGRQLCVRPSAAWVQKIISYLDAKFVAGQASNL